ncbi:uncharacterized protein LOC141679563 [Apium graveolens]|uniref:uncharacterized protein LOC141679563 n=1 Tax=Apium graveolens TaxID=4045 RepID=UPI003D7BECEA
MIAHESREEKNTLHIKSRFFYFNCSAYGYYSAECKKPRRDREVNEEGNIDQIPDDEPSILMVENKEGEKGNLLINKERVKSNLNKNNQLSEDAAFKLQEGIQLLLSQWSSLQVAVENEFGGPDSRRKSQQLPVDLFSWFTKSAGPIYIDDLENMLDDFMLSLNTELDDGSIEEISEKLMIMHEECLEGNFMSIERLRDAPRVSVPQIKQLCLCELTSD